MNRQGYQICNGGVIHMLIRVNRETLSDAIGDVTKAVSTKTTMPILTGIKMEALDDALILTASNSDISIECRIPAKEEEEEIVKVEEKGKVVLPARYFSDIIRRLPGDEMTMSVNEQMNIHIEAGQSEFNLNGMDADEFPDLPSILERNVFSMPSDLLKTMIRQTVFAASTSETRPILTGVMWTLEEGKLTFVATDSHRLVTRQATVEAGQDFQFSQPCGTGKKSE